MDNKEKMKKYLKDTVNPIFEQLIIDILVDSPTNFIDYSIKWLDIKGRKLEKGEKLPRGFQPVLKKDLNINV